MKTAIFKTIEIGALPKQEILRQLEEQDVYVSAYAKNIIERMSEEKIEKIDLVKLTVKDLGFTGPAKWKAILSKAQELGYELCPQEVGPILALNWNDQQKGSCIYIGMGPITDSDGDPSVFYVRRDDGGERWLHTSWVDSDDEWRLGRVIVFRLRKGTEKSGTESLSLDPKNFEARLGALEAFEKKVRAFLILE